MRLMVVSNAATTYPVSSPTAASTGISPRLCAASMVQPNPPGVRSPVATTSCRKPISASARGTAAAVRSPSGPAESNQPAAISSSRSRPCWGQPMRSMITCTGRSWARSVTASKRPRSANRPARPTARSSMLCMIGRSARGESRSVNSGRCWACAGGSMLISAADQAWLKPSLRPIPPRGGERLPVGQRGAHPVVAGQEPQVVAGEVGGRAEVAKLPVVRVRVGERPVAEQVEVAFQACGGNGHGRSPSGDGDGDGDWVARRA